MTSLIQWIAFLLWTPLFLLGSLGESYSQASQDKFVHLLLYEILGKQDDGYYLEIGAGHPTNINNTYSFEKNFGWKGVSLDIASDIRELWNLDRHNTLLIENALYSNYRSILEPFPSVVDYLSLDIDNNYDIVLQAIPFHEYTFKVITIEHDSYHWGDRFKNEERRILASLGYYLLCPDVSMEDSTHRDAFEDWWIHPNAFPSDVFSKLASMDLQAKNHDQIIALIQQRWGG